MEIVTFPISIWYRDNLKMRWMKSFTALVTPMGLYRWKRLSKCLASTLEFSQKVIKLIMAGLSYEVALVYLDNIIICGKSFEYCLNRPDLKFGQLEDAGLKKGQKRKFFRKNSIPGTHCIKQWLRNGSGQVSRKKRPQTRKNWEL